MRYVDFRDQIITELRRSKSGLTWKELKEKLDLPYRTPCPEWVKRMEEEDWSGRKVAEERWCGKQVDNYSNGKFLHQCLCASRNRLLSPI
jgi:hypothetical protein